MTESKNVGISDTLAQDLLDHTPRELYLRAVRAEVEVERLRRMVRELYLRAGALEQTLREIHAHIPDKNDPDYDGHRESLELALGSIEDLCTRAVLTDHPIAGGQDQDQARFERAWTQLVYSLADYFALEVTDAQARSIAREVLQAADASDHEPHRPTAGEPDGPMPGCMCYGANTPELDGWCACQGTGTPPADHPDAGEQDTNKKGPANA